MKDFNMGEAWSLAVAFLQQHLQMLIMLIIGGMVVVGLLDYFGGGANSQAAQMEALSNAISSGDWKALAQANRGTAGVGAAGFAIVGAIIQMAVQFAALRVGLGDEREEVGSALSYGFAAAVMQMLVIILAVVAAVIVIGLPIVLIIVAMGGASGGTPSGGMIGLLILLALAVLVLVIWISVRLTVIQPAMADARSTSPIYGIKESWRLTEGNFWPLFGYTLLIGIVMGIAFAIVGGIVAVVGGFAGGLVAALLMAVLVTGPASIAGLAINAGIYKALTPDSRYDIFN